MPDKAGALPGIFNATSGRLSSDLFHESLPQDTRACPGVLPQPGIFATTLISKSKPYSQVTPTAVTVG